TYHVVPGSVLAAQAAAAGEAETLNGASVNFSFEAGQLQVNETNIVATDVQASNGVIHAIDAVLLPPGFALPSQASDQAATPDKLIRLAIKRGVPLYNRGQHSACAAVYEVALMALSSHGKVEAVSQAIAMHALEHGRGMHDMDARAWAFRRGLDGVRERMMSTR
ncbi:MAG: fasciclin domain-containing protein, partial [Planctomycetota bacterium]